MMKITPLFVHFKISTNNNKKLRETIDFGEREREREIKDNETNKKIFSAKFDIANFFFIEINICEKFHFKQTKL